METIGTISRSLALVCLYRLLSADIWPSIICFGGGSRDPLVYQGHWQGGAIDIAQRRTSARGGFAPTPW